jgi:ubiquinone/menaquinone biosynthesis C-methylase UbiE
MKQASYVYDTASECEKVRLRTRDTGTRTNRDIALEGVRLGEVRSILDVGCGTGVLGFHLLELAPSAALVGLDIAATMVEEARRNIPEGRSCRFIQGSAYDMPFERASFDLVASQYVLQHLAEPVIALKEMRRVTKVGSMAMIFEWDDRVNFSYPPLPSELDALLEAKNLLIELRGGDRSIGRKLYHHLRAAGWCDISVKIIPSILQGPAERDFKAARLSFQQLKPQILQAGLLSEHVFEAGLQQFESYYRGDVFCVLFFFAAFARNSG